MPDASREIALVSVYSHRGCTLKDVAGGFGTVFEVGASLPARILERAKRRVADLPPLVLGYLSAELARASHRVRVYDLHPGSPTPPERTVILLSSITDATAERALCARLRARGTRVLVIGAYASARPEHYADVAHAVVRGEPEALGAALLDASGVVDAGDVTDLDALPFPDWDPFPIRRYRYAFLPGPVLPVGSARGCAFGCAYCPWRVTARFRERDPDRVGAEVRALVARWGARGIAFRDPLLNLDEARVRALCRALRPIGVRFSAELRADRLDDALLEELHGAGLRSLEIGVESIDRALLAKEKRKPPTHAQIERVVRRAQSLGIRVICNFVLGLPGDDEPTMRETIAWAKRLNAFAAQFTVATPYPGTSLADEVAHRRLEVLPDAHTGFRPTFAHATVPPERLAALREWAYVSYHYRPRYALGFARHAASAILDGAPARP
jgi:radical SAM superfamily enzyme YgiQ (UPF0313 family)